MGNQKGNLDSSEYALKGDLFERLNDIESFENFKIKEELSANTKWHSNGYYL